MAKLSRELRRSLPALGAAIPIVIVFVAVLSILLTAAGPEGLRLSERQTTGWIFVIYGLPAIPSVLLTLRYRQPLLLTGNVFAIIFLGSVGTQIGFDELAGAACIAGAIVVAVSAMGFTRQIAAMIPPPIVHALIAGAVTPFVADVFSALSTVDEQGLAVEARVPIMVASAVVAYLASRRLLGTRLPPIFAALVAGVAAAGLTGQFGNLPREIDLPNLAIGLPAFSPAGVATATPVLVVLMLLQSNLPAVVYMRSEGWHPPGRVIDVASGVTTMAASFIGPTAISLALPLVPFTAGPAAGERSIRYRSVFIPVVALAGIALLASAAADVAELVPPLLLLVLGGLAMVSVLAAALREVTRGPLILGPVFAFAIALSDMRLLELGPFFWSLALGTAISIVLERDEWRRLRAEMAASESVAEQGERGEVGAIEAGTPSA